MADETDEGLELVSPSSGTGATVPPERRGRPRRPFVVALIVLLAALLALVGVGVFYIARLNQALSDIPRETLLPTGNRPAELPTPPDQSNRPQAYVLIGADKRGTDPGRSDALMVAYLPADRKQVYLISFPRDIWVDIPGHGQAKINAAYAFGGAPLTVATLEQLLAVRMDHTAVIDFEGYVKLTDALGGVEVNNKHAGGWGGYDFPQGRITIKGKQALAYVRERKDLPNGDLDRNERQRAVTKAIIAKAMSAGVLSNPVTFSDMLGKLKDTLVVDDTLTDAVLRDTAMGMKLTGAKDVVTLSAPVGEPGWSEDGQWIWQNDTAGMAALAQAMRDDRMAEWAAAHPKDQQDLPATPTKSR